eukprot:594428-Pyramimonas_sp.AAC.1
MRAVPLGPPVELPMGQRNAELGGGERMRAVPLGTSVEVRMGPRNAVLVGGDAHLGLRWSTL